MGINSFQGGIGGTYMYILNQYLQEVGGDHLAVPPIRPHSLKNTPYKVGFVGTDSLSNWREIQLFVDRSNILSKVLGGDFKRNAATFNLADLKIFVDHYSTNPITYEFNSDGIRDEDLSLKPNEVNVHLGCSFTEGTGLPIEYTWPYFLDKHLNYPSINAGMGGTGLMTQFRILIYLSTRFKIKNVFHLFHTSSYRYEWDLGNEKAEYGNYMFGEDERFDKDTMKLLSSHRNGKYLGITMLSAFIGFCKEHDINYFYYDFCGGPPGGHGIGKGTEFTELYKEETLVNRWARDLMHFGPKIQAEIAETFFNSYLEKVGKS